jgi:hypothetical protein
LHWALRSVLIMPGYAMAGVRGKQLVIGALGGSTMISLFLMLYTAAMRGKHGKQLAGRHRRALAARRQHALVRKSQRQLGHRPKRLLARDVSSLELMQRAERRTTRARAR